MSNIVFFKIPQRAPEPPEDELAKLLQNSGLLELMRELAAKVGVMRNHLTKVRTISDGATGREDLS